MRRDFTLPLSVLMVVLSISSATAQWQFCFGISPGMRKMFPTHPVEKITLHPKMSITLQSGINYSFSRMVSTMFLISFSNYAAFAPSLEAEWEGSYNYPLSKKLRIKCSAGIAGAFLNNTHDNLPEYVSFVPYWYQFNEDNLFIVLKSGLQWKAPGRYHSVYFGADYHWGMRKAHKAICYDSDHSIPAITVWGRGSYLALNMIILIGKEKYSWKKSLSAKDKAQLKRSSVM